MRLEAQRLSQCFGGRTVLEHVSLTVDSGEIVGLVGPNGAGKSTLLKLLVGLLRPDDGQVLIDGRDVARVPTWRRARLGLGYLPQEASAFSGLSVRRNLDAVLELGGGSGASSGRSQDAGPAGRAARRDSLLAAFGLAGRAAQRAATLSGGERRRLELARLLALDRTLLLLDEPFKGLDPRAAEALGEELRQRRARGVGVLLCDHHVEHALASCQRIHLLVEGRLVVCGTAEEVRRHVAAQDFFARSAAGSASDQPGS